MQSLTIAAHSRHEPKKPACADFFATFGNTKSLSTVNSGPAGVFGGAPADPGLSLDHPDSTVVFGPQAAWPITHRSGKDFGSRFRALLAGHDCTMLPGFRLLAIIVALAASVLVFGLGAAAFLRATHEEFAAAPLRNLQTPVSSFVVETPTLAVLQVEPPPAEPPLAEPPASQPVDPVLAPAPTPAPTPLITEAETATPEDEAAIPRIVIPDPPSIPLTDAITTASIEAQPQPAAKPAAAPVSAIKTRAVARKRAAIRAKARARARAHHHYRRRIVRPAPPPPVEQSFFPLFAPAATTAAAPAPTVASTLPPRR